MTTINDLRNALLLTVEDLRKKKIEPNAANAISKVAQTIVKMTRLELDYYQMVKENGKHSNKELFQKNGKKFLPEKSAKKK